ncbi:hypothetical protein WDZ11_22260 (plasmid) [Roseomonas mucosa]|uniref:hypothetical protein n=1 Tax=Roseomonas mucosa TaxID=207340 RepID=UPI0030D597C8
MGEPNLIPQDAEWIVGDLLTNWIVRRDLRQLLPKRGLYTHLDKPGIFQTKPLTPAQLKHLLASEEVRIKSRVKQWLNELPEDEAIRLYRDTPA